MPEWEIRRGHVVDVLRAMPDESVQMVCSSPPYWSLRNYSTESQVWGGDPECSHEWGADVVDRSRATPGVEGSGLTASGARHQAAAARFETRSAFCSRCAAWGGSLGLEPTPALYLDHIVEVFREVRRVLRKDGTLWLNLGDSFAAKADASQGATYRRDRAVAMAPAFSPVPAGAETEGPGGDALARRLRPPGGRLVAPLRHHLGEAESDAGERHRPADSGPRVPLPPLALPALLLRRRGRAGADGAGHPAPEHRFHQ